MIQQSRLLGVSLRTRRNRRLFVAGYYLFVLACTSIPLLCGARPVDLLAYLPQSVLLGGLLGGIMYGGAVKPYSTSVMFNRDPASLDPISLNLDGGAVRRQEQPLDERETTERDHAHFLAYRILLGLMVAMMLTVWLLAGIPAVSVQRTVPVLVLLLVITAFSLPQTVILWIEPDAHPEGNLALV